MHRLQKKVLRHLSSLSLLFIENKNLLDKKWAEMLDALPDNDVRYVIIDVFYDTNDGAREEILFIAW